MWPSGFETYTSSGSEFSIKLHLFSTLSYRMCWQAHEMVHIEKGGLQQMTDELEVYGELLPQSNILGVKPSCVMHATHALHVNCSLNCANALHACWGLVPKIPGLLLPQSNEVTCCQHGLYAWMIVRIRHLLLCVQLQLSCSRSATPYRWVPV